MLFIIYTQISINKVLLIQKLKLHHSLRCIDLGYISETLGAALSEHDRGPYLQQFRRVHKAESHEALVTRT